MYPHDKEPDYRQAFTAAEDAWMRWSQSPHGDPDDPDHGYHLLENFIYAARAYCHHVEKRTASLLYGNQRPGSGEAGASDIVASDDDLAIPAFLRRRAD